ncbi:unnamed protein product [Bursaphelenchus xylophilus]|uniref:(pine wood nematode) hypothetical protein n=1 Tax=Bursaphelenchus xylophilus TaxID=6326 RepID=A0A1I7S2D9_BURXY|nr:unnamed protein product [Bursaphelenchus xylophilus]CAG9114638.1 unnamed protein product [Bursaphelenchus xylophilus]
MKIVMYFLILCCAFSLNLGAAKRFEYDGNYPYIDSWFTAVNPIKFFKIKLEIEYVFSFYFGKECAANCTNSPISPTYDNDIYNAVRTKNASIVYKYQAYTGDQYQGYLETDLTSPDGNATFDVITKAYGPAPLDAPGVLGLFVAGNRDFTMRKIFSEMGRTKQIIFRRGPFVQYLPTSVRVNPKGVFSTGAESLDGCGSFTYFPTIRNQGWKIKAGIKLADEVFDNRTVEFSLDSLTTVPKEVYKKYFKNVKVVDDLPNLALITGNGEFPINSTNFAQYKNKYRDELSAYAQSQKFEISNFILGDNFLSDYCIALRATNAEISEFEIGLASATEIERDPKWEKNIPPGRDDEGGDGDGGKGGDSASTAVLNIMLVVVLYLGVAT